MSAAPASATTTTAESFFSALKNEWLHRFVFVTQVKVKSQVMR
ncbi:unnamed protein product [[Actinomadura] parvosata subsp. kistnae]|nr:unnamed protein product [Actinomadura parvosata subsp. kistnae]